MTSSDNILTLKGMKKFIKGLKSRSKSQLGIETEAMLLLSVSSNSRSMDLVDIEKSLKLI